MNRGPNWYAAYVVEVLRSDDRCHYMTERGTGNTSTEIVDAQLFNTHDAADSARGGVYLGPTLVKKVTVLIMGDHYLDGTDQDDYANDVEFLIGVPRTNTGGNVMCWIFDAPDGGQLLFGYGNGFLGFSLQDADGEEIVSGEGMRMDAPEQAEYIGRVCGAFGIKIAIKGAR